MWANKQVHLRYVDGDWRPAMVDGMPVDEGDEHYGYPMPDFVDALGMENWELVSAVPVDSPEPGLLLLLFKRPDDHELDTLSEVPGALERRSAVLQESPQGSEPPALGKVLKQLRVSQNLTQGKVAYRAGTAPEYISMLESGLRKNPGSVLFARLAIALGVTPDYILARAGIISITEQPPLDPEVARIAGILAAWPEGTSRRSARAAVSLMGDLLEQVVSTQEGEGDEVKQGTLNFTDEPAVGG